ncbi:hypothetical protein V2J09_009241 [Rumex salicifolius]
MKPTNPRGKGLRYSAGWSSPFPHRPPAGPLIWCVSRLQGLKRKCCPSQFGSENGHEIQVIDCRTQQDRLFPLLASACAFRFVSEWLKWLYTDVMQKLQAKDFSTLPEAHACTAGLKSLTTSFTSDAIDECRKLCGGHGYLCSSGLPELFAVYAPSCTYEGDNVVLFYMFGWSKIYLVACN